MPDIRPTEIEIRSSHGLIGDRAFLIDQTGQIIEVSVRVLDFGPLPEVFDVEEYQSFYSRLDDSIDICDIGYSLADGTKVKPVADFRLRYLTSILADLKYAAQCVVTSCCEKGSVGGIPSHLLVQLETALKRSRGLAGP